MSLLFKDDLEEYARQCTLQRRQYEACIQQAQQAMVSADSVQTMAQASKAGANESIDDPEAERHLEAIRQSCLLELLEIDADPLVWEDECQSLDEIRQSITAGQNAAHDRAQSHRQTVTNPTGKSTAYVSYGAP